MADLNLPALGLRDVLPRGEKLAKYYILEGTCYLHVYQDSNAVKNLLDKVVELSQHLNVVFQGGSRDAMAHLIKETLRKLIILLKSSSLTNEFYNAVKILYNKSLNLKTHQLASVLANGAEQMWKTINDSDEKRNALRTLYSTIIGDCNVTIKENQANDVEITAYLDNVLVPNIQKLINSNADLIKALERVDIEDIALDNVYEVHILCTDPVTNQPNVSVDKISNYIANIMSGYFNVASILGFRLLIRLVNTVGIRGFVKMARVSHDIGRFFFRDQETIQRTRQDIREANRQLLRGITGIGSSIISPLYSAIKSHPLGRLLVGIGEFGYRQLYLRTGRFLGLGYRHSDYRSYYESRIPSPFDNEEAWASFSSKTKTDFRLEYEKDRRLRDLQNFLKSKNPKYEDEHEVMKLLTNEHLLDRARDYLLLRSKKNLDDAEENRLRRAISYISKVTGLTDEKDISKFVELYTRYRDVSGILSERVLGRETLRYEPAPEVTTTPLPSIKQMPQQTSGTQTTQTTKTTQTTSPSPTSSPAPSTPQTMQMEEETSAEDVETGIIEESETQTKTVTEDEKKEIIKHIHNAIQQMVTTNGERSLQITTDFSNSLVKIIDRIIDIRDKREESETEITEKDLEILKKEMKGELTSNICEIINCVQKSSTQAHITGKDIEHLQPVIESIVENLVKRLYLDKSSDKTGKTRSLTKKASKDTTSKVSGSQPSQAVVNTQKSSVTSQVKSTSKNIQQATVSSKAVLPQTSPQPSTSTIVGTTSPTQPTGQSVRQQPSNITTGGQSISTSKSRKPVFRSRWLAYGKKVISPIVRRRAVATTSAAGGMSGLGATLVSRTATGAAIRGLLGGGRMLSMLVNPAGIALGAGLLGLAGYGGYKILTKAILPQIKGEGFSFVEAKRQEIIDNIIEKITSSEGMEQKLANRFQSIQPTRISLVGGGSEQTARIIRAGNAKEIKLTPVPAAFSGVKTENIRVEAPEIPKTAPITPTNIEKQTTETRSREEEKQQQARVEQVMKFSSLSGEAQAAAHQYNQQVIAEAHLALNQQIIDILHKQKEAIQKLNAELDKIISDQNSKKPSIIES